MNNPYAQADWMQTAPSPYQQGMGGGYQPQAIPGSSSFGDRQAAIGQQLANQSAQNAGGSRAGISSGLGGSALDPQKMAAGLRKIGSKLGDAYDQFSTANTYGTNPYSQQSQMLAQQDAGFGPSFSESLSGVGDWFSGLGSSLGGATEGLGEALPAIGEAAEEVAPFFAALL